MSPAPQDTDTTRIGDADVVARVVSYLPGHPRLPGVTPEQVGGQNQPPYPRFVVTDPPGASIGDARWVLTSVVQVEVLGDTSTTMSRAVLKSLAYGAVDALRMLPEQAHDPAWPVITNVSMTPPGWSPLGTGQPRYVFRATITSHP